MDFDAWARRYGKTYSTPEAEARAKENWVANDARIRAHNALPNATFTMGHNPLSDLNETQFKRLLGWRPPETRRLRRSLAAASPPPATVDWVQRGALTPIKNQGQCGSCWAFSTVAAVESATFLSTGTLQSLSEQDLVDCTSANYGCGGGTLDAAFDEVDADGLPTEDAYPYTGTDGNCQAASGARTDISGWAEASGEEAYLAAVAEQPISVAVAANSAWQLYDTGIINVCGGQIDHAVVVVGYDMGGSYWNIRNSWGEDWGECGYVRVQMTNDSYGMCGMYAYPAYYPRI